MFKERSRSVHRRGFVICCVAAFKQGAARRDGVRGEEQAGKRRGAGASQTRFGREGCFSEAVTKHYYCNYLISL